MEDTFFISALRKSLIWIMVWLSLVCMIVPALSARAPTNENDQNFVSSFMDSTAKGIYALAWPTATYREVHLNGFERAPGGYNIYVKISGNSGFDGSDLWMRLVVLVRSGSIDDVKVQDHNAIIAAPFQTLIAAGTLASELAKESARDRAAAAGNAPASPPAPRASVPPQTPAHPVSQMAGAVCVENPTDRTIAYSYRWGDGDWKQDSLDPNEDSALSWTYKSGDRTSPQLTVRFDSDFAPGYQERTYSLARMQSTLPIVCANVSEYRFGITGTAIRLYNNDSTEAAR